MYAFDSRLSFGRGVQIVDLCILAIFLVIWQMKNFGDRSTSVSASVFFMIPIYSDESCTVTMDTLLTELPRPVERFKKQVAQRATIAHLRASKSSKYFE